VVVTIRTTGSVTYRSRAVGTSTVLDLSVGGVPVSFLIRAGGGIARL
jgi:hypothetical protein